MSERLLPVPEACRQALAAIEADPLNLPPGVRAHLQTCAACAEARVQWLAQEDVPPALAPAGYFERLPERIQRKLPARRSVRIHHHPWLWLAAAGLALALAIGGFLAGRVQRAPVMEANVPAEATELLPEIPFEETEDVMFEFSNLTPEEAEAVLKRLDSSGIPHP